MVEFEVSGDKIEAIYMIPGWTHNIINLSDTEDLVMVMTCNEVFDPSHPDTFLRKCREKLLSKGMVMLKRGISHGKTAIH